MFHVPDLGRDDDAVVMPAGARQDAEQFVLLGIDHGNAAGEALKAAERHQHIFAVIGDGGRLQIGTDALNFLFIFQVAVSTTITPLAAGEGCSTDR